MPRQSRALRLTAACAVTAALAAGTLAGAGNASAASPFLPYVRDQTLGPGYSSEVTGGAGGIADGTAVYVFSKNPLTDATWAGGGLPTGLSASISGTTCTAYSGTPGVYTCPVTEDNPLDSPSVKAATSAANHTTAYVGAAYAARGTSLATAIKAAEMAGTAAPSEDGQTAAVITVLTPDEVAKSTVQLTTPDVPLSSSTVHTVHVHAADPAHLDVTLEPSLDERWMDQNEVDVDVTAVDGGPAGACTHTTGSLGGAWCDLPAGDYTITYTLTSGPDVEAWKLVADATLQVVDYGSSNPETTSTFQVLSPTPVTERYRIFGRASAGDVHFYDGTGTATTPFRPADYFQDGWQNYNAATALSAVTEHGTGDAVARDTGGTLWYYRGTGTHYWDIYQPRDKVGAGWNIYTSIVGARDLSGDGRADLVARDTSGTLWLYKGTSSTTAQFATRTKIGAGWNIYKTLTGAGDLTGDGKADLLATDTSGVLWLYKGTGNAAAPYAARVKVGTGWNIYTVLLAPGDLSSDGKTDLVARDSAGTLWLYQGTGNATTPYSARTKIGAGWNTYNLMF
ncbi:FG-GAP repeat domain-containing protein [Actinacidiphila rubida]|uniref:Repeat domain-containing protein n=1 Tax=Actinacidiphila rubida TaxID=310780 RepID=A0A1H8GTC4_9ACTN|nr:VCBS repeat-containing protein [Actinacidiphila rubida]SEN46528.1 Repeat domain-containing protein [Actinacidiphila rubida]